MPQIGWFELLIIVVIAILVIGPKDFPLVLRKVGGWIGSIKRYISNIQNEVSSIGDEVNNIKNEPNDNSDESSDIGKNKDVW